MRTDRIEPPWAESIVDALNEFQRAGAMHPFTCGQDSHHVLIATRDGWVCPYDDYTQKWAHLSMTWPEARTLPPGAR
jgi:hypothetical protein